jgi:hypothetical protein
VRGVARHQAQRPAQRLQLDREARLVGAEVDQPGGDAVVTGGAALAQVPDRLVGGLAVRR